MRLAGAGGPGEGVEGAVERRHRPLAALREVDGTGLAAQLHPGAAARHGRGEAERQRAGGAADVAQHEVDGVQRAGHGGHRGDVPEDREQHRERVRADVPQRALLLAPRGGRVRAGGVRGEDRAEPVGASGEPAAGGRLLLDPRHLVAAEADGEEHHRRDAVAPGRLDHPEGVGDGERHGLVEQQVAAGLGGADREVGLHGRGSAMETASTSASSRSRSAWAGTPCCAPRAAAASGRRPQTPANSKSGCAARTGACTRSAQGPVPSSPMRMVVSLLGGASVLCRALCRAAV